MNKRKRGPNRITDRMAGNRLIFARNDAIGQSTSSIDIQRDKHAWESYLTSDETQIFYDEQHQLSFVKRSRRNGRKYWYARKRHRNKTYTVYVCHESDLDIGSITTAANSLLDKILNGAKADDIR